VIAEIRRTRFSAGADGKPSRVWLDHADNSRPVAGSAGVQ
jgi:hypothetical protein